MVGIGGVQIVVSVVGLKFDVVGAMVGCVELVSWTAGSEQPLRTSAANRTDTIVLITALMAARMPPRRPLVGLVWIEGRGFFIDEQGFFGTQVRRVPWVAFVNVVGVVPPTPSSGSCGAYVITVGHWPLVPYP